MIVCFIVFRLSDGVAAGSALKEYSPRRGVASSGRGASSSSSLESELSESERQSMTDKALALSSESEPESSDAGGV